MLDEPAPLPPGPVLVTIQKVEAQTPVASGYRDAERAELSDRIAAIAAITGPPVPDDRQTAKDYESILSFRST